MEFTIAIVVTWSTAAAAVAATEATAAVATTTIRTLTLAATATAAAVTTACALAAPFALTGFAFAHAGEHFCAGSLGGSLHHVAARRLACATPNGLATHGDRLALFTRLGAKTFDDLHRNILLGEALDVLHEAFFVQAH